MEYEVIELIVAMYDSQTRFALIRQILLVPFQHFVKCRYRPGLLPHRDLNLKIVTVTYQQFLFIELQASLNKNHNIFMKFHKQHTSNSDDSVCLWNQRKIWITSS